MSAQAQAPAAPSPAYADIAAAAERLAGVAQRTPVLTSRTVFDQDLDHAVVTVAGELDLSTAPRLGEALAEVVERHPHELTVDLAELAFAGHYPAVPWLAYLLVGLALGRCDLTRWRAPAVLAAVGARV